MMKHLIPLAAVLGLAATTNLARAADQPAPAPKPEAHELRVLGSTDGAAPRASAQRRIVIQHGSGEKESVTFLGIEATPVPPVLTAQLGLPKGAGLVVNHVVPDSAAVGALQENDILLKLDDQLLIEARQLSVLVRNHQEGDEVTLTYIRGGKQATAKVKLGKHEVPKEVSGLFGQPFPAGAAAGAFTISPGKLGAMPNGENRAEVDRVLNLMRTPGDQPVRMQIFGQSGPGGFSATSVNTANSTLAYTDDNGSLELTTKDGKKSLVAKDAKGEQQFDGPVTTPEERKALPADVRARLEKLEAMHGVTFHTDGDFQGVETRTIRPAPRGITFPQPMPRRPAAAQFF
jgi:serine protease Do